MVVLWCCCKLHVTDRVCFAHFQPPVWNTPHPDGLKAERRCDILPAKSSSLLMLVFLVDAQLLHTQLDLTRYNPESHPRLGRQGLDRSLHLSPTCREREREKKKGSSASARCPKPARQRKWMLRWESALWGLFTRREREERIEAHATESWLVYPAPGHWGAPLRSLLRTTKERTGAGARPSVRRHHVSGNSFDSRRVQDWFRKHRWRPWPE